MRETWGKREGEESLKNISKDYHRGLLFAGGHSLQGLAHRSYKRSLLILKNLH